MRARTGLAVSLHRTLRALRPVVSSLALPILSSAAPAQCPRVDLPIDAAQSAAYGGAHLVIGAPYVHGQTTQNGAAWLLDPLTGTPVDRIANPYPLAGYTGFGWAVAADGGLLAVGAPSAHPGTAHEGAVFLFDEASGTLLAEIAPPAGVHGLQFGFAVALGGNRLVVGSPGTHDGGIGRGAAFVYDVTSGQLVHRLRSSTASDNDAFGLSVTIDGPWILVGAPIDQDLGADTGSVHLFDVATGKERAVWTAADGAPDRVGQSVALGGGRAILGGQKGGVRVRDLQSGVETMAIDLPAEGAASLALEGDRLVVGTPEDATSGGSAHLLDLASGAVVDSVYRTSKGADGFGWAVALEGDRFAVVDEQADAHVLLFDVCSPVGTVYCDPAVDNSTGAPGTLEAGGSDQVSDDTFSVTASSLPPDRLTLLLASMSQDFVPNAGGSQGTLCLGGTIARYTALSGRSTGAGTWAHAIDLTAVPFDPPVAVMPGETWNFQLWYRDVNPAKTSNFTNAVSVAFH